MNRNKREIGNKYESAARKYLISKGYQIIGSNFYSKRYGEIDIITKYSDRIVFVEVKGRKNFKFGKGENAITHAKKVKLINSCQLWIMINNCSTDWQIDVIAIDEVEQNSSVVLKLRHYKNCIYLDELN